MGQGNLASSVDPWFFYRPDLGDFVLCDCNWVMAKHFHSCPLPSHLLVT